MVGSGECVRLKNFVINAELTGNLILNCGLYDFEFDGDDKNGEGIYIGTSFSQVQRRPFGGQGLEERGVFHMYRKPRLQ